MIELFDPLLAAVWLAAAGWSAWMAFPSSSTLRAAREGFAKNTLAYLDPSFAAAFDARTRRNHRVSALCLLTIVTSLVVVLRQMQLSLRPMLVSAPILGIGFALQSADRLRDAGRQFVVPGGRAAVARPRRVRLSDYVSPRAQLLTWSSVSVAVIATALLLGTRDE